MASVPIEGQGEYEYYIPQTLPFTIPVVFQNFEYTIDITEILKRAALISFGLGCQGSYGCKYIEVKLLDANKSVKVKLTINNVYEIGALGRNPGGALPFVTVFDDALKTYVAAVNPEQKIFLDGIVLQLKIPSVSQIQPLLPQGQTVNVGEQAVVEVDYLIEAIRNSFIWGGRRV